MIGYVTLGVNDMARAKAFYSELLGELGGKELMAMDRIAFFGKSMDTPMLAVCQPYDGNPPSVGNGTMVALPGGTKENVDKLYQKALSLGATSEGEPGQRIPDMFYGAYVRDLDGNKLAFFVFG
jgi:predicted lactoylglutathione lyase